MRRLTRARAATDDEDTPQETAASQPVGEGDDAQQGGGGVPANGASGSEDPTVVLARGDTATNVPAPAAAPAPASDVLGRDLPAGVDPGELAAAPTSARRGRLRRRLRYLRHVRELLLRDLGGFFFEAHRSDEGTEGHRSILEAKAARLAKLDEEMRELESRLGDPRRETVLREPGIGGTCPHCGELHASEARYCSRCGNPLTGRAARERAATRAGTTPPAAEEPKATTASLWGRPKRPEPPPPADETQPSGELRRPTPPAAQRAAAETKEPAAKKARPAAGKKEPAAKKPKPAAPEKEEPAATEQVAEARSSRSDS